MLAWPVLVSVGFRLLKFLPFGSTVATFLPALGTIASGVGGIFAAIAKVAATFIEGVLEALHHPKVLMVIAVAFVYGTIFSNDKHAAALAQVRAERCDCRGSTAKPKQRTSVPEFDLYTIPRWLGL